MTGETAEEEEVMGEEDGRNIKERMGCGGIVNTLDLWRDREQQHR